MLTLRVSIICHLTSEVGRWADSPYHCNDAIARADRVLEIFQIVSLPIQPGETLYKTSHFDFSQVFPDSFGVKTLGSDGRDPK
jgi:hypothetical protein